MLGEWEALQGYAGIGLILPGTYEYERFSKSTGELKALDELLAKQNLSKKEIEHIKELSRQIYHAQENKKMTDSIAESVDPLSGSLATLATTPLVPVTGLEYLVKAFKWMGDQLIPEDERVPADFYDSTSTAYNFRKAIMDGTSNAIAQTPLGKVGASVYQGLTGISDSLSMAALTKATGVPFNVLQQLGDGTDAYYSARLRGATEDQAIILGGLESVAGIVFQEVPFKKILKLDTPDLLGSLSQSSWDSIRKKVGKSSAREAVSLINDLLATQDKNRLNKMYQDYLKQGFDEKKATEAVFRDVLEGVFWGSI